MSNAHWRLGQGRDRPVELYPRAKRPRHSFDIPSGSNVSSCYAREIGRPGYCLARDTTNSIIPTLELTSISPGFGGHHHNPLPLPLDASPTLFVEGIPANCTRREVAHIFRPFLGYKEVRLVTKEIRHSWVERLVLCFVDFESPAHAAIAMDALQANGSSFTSERCVGLVL